MGVRKIKPTTVSITGVHGGTGEEFESSIELDVMRLLHFDPYVQSLKAQPLEIKYFDSNGIRRRYTPDVLVEFKPNLDRRPVLCEIKSKRQLHKNIEEIRPKIIAGYLYAKSRGWRFKVITDVKIRNSYLKNVNFLRRYRLYQQNIEIETRLLSLVAELVECTYEQIFLELGCDDKQKLETLPSLWRLISTFKICTDLNKPLDRTSILFTNEDYDLCRYISSPVA